MNTELIREIKEEIYKKLESFIGTALPRPQSVDDNTIYDRYRKTIMNEFYKYEHEFRKTTDKDYIDFLYKIDFTIGENRIIEDIEVIFEAPECIADIKEIK